MSSPQQGEIWIVDLGPVAKTRPAMVVSVPLLDEDRALVTIVPHTTSTRQTRFEVPVTARFLKPGAFEVQNIQTISLAKFVRRLGMLPDGDFERIETMLRQWLGL